MPHPKAQSKLFQRNETAATEFQIAKAQRQPFELADRNALVNMGLRGGAHFAFVWAGQDADEFDATVPKALEPFTFPLFDFRFGERTLFVPVNHLAS
jgi:hypothetical protein